MVLNTLFVLPFRCHSQGVLLQNLVKCQSVLRRAKDEALQCAEKGVDLSRGIIKSLNQEEALVDIDTTI